MENKNLQALARHLMAELCISDNEVRSLQQRYNTLYDLASEVLTIATKDNHSDQLPPP